MSLIELYKDPFKGNPILIMNAPTVPSGAAAGTASWEMSSTKQPQGSSPWCLVGTGGMDPFEDLGSL